MPANGDVINTEDSEEALEEKEFIETNLAQEYAVDILKSMIKREDNFQPKVSCIFSPYLLVLKLDFDSNLSLQSQKSLHVLAFENSHVWRNFAVMNVFLVHYLIF